MCVCILVSLVTTRGNVDPELRMRLTWIGSNTDLMESRLSRDNIQDCLRLPCKIKTDMVEQTVNV